MLAMTLMQHNGGAEGGPEEVVTAEGPEDVLHRLRHLRHTLQECHWRVQLVDNTLTAQAAAASALQDQRNGFHVLQTHGGGGFQYQAEDNWNQSGERCSFQNKAERETDLQIHAREETYLQNQSGEETILQNQAGVETDLHKQARDEAYFQKQNGEENDLQNQAGKENDLQKQVGDNTDFQNQIVEERDLQNLASEETNLQNQAGEEADLKNQYGEEGDLQNQTEAKTVPQNQAGEETVPQTRAVEENYLQNKVREETVPQNQAGEETDLQNHAGEETDLQNQGRGGVQKTAKSSRKADGTNSIPIQHRRRIIRQEGLDSEEDNLPERESFEEVTAGETKDAPAGLGEGQSPNETSQERQEITEVVDTGQNLWTYSRRRQKRFRSRSVHFPLHSPALLSSQSSRALHILPETNMREGGQWGNLTHCEGDASATREAGDQILHLQEDLNLCPQRNSSPVMKKRRLFCPSVVSEDVTGLGLRRRESSMSAAGKLLRDCRESLVYAMVFVLLLVLLLFLASCLLLVVPVVTVSVRTFGGPAAF